MDKYINELKKIPFSNKDVLEALDGKTKIIKYPDLHKYKNIESVLSPYNSAVLLYMTKPNYGHWVCIHLNDNGILEFFDPYGLKIDEQLNFINSNFAFNTYQDYPYLSKLMLDSPYKLTYNNKKLQKQVKNMNSCGRHIALRLILKELPLTKYQKILLNNDLDSDTTVTYLTAFI